jgi:2-methylcitrate dehydratase PrpD
MDDYFPAGTAHPGVYVIPAALAAAEENNSAPSTLLRGIIFGYDIVSRLGSMTAA